MRRLLFINAFLNLSEFTFTVDGRSLSIYHNLVKGVMLGNLVHLPGLWIGKCLQGGLFNDSFHEVLSVAAANPDHTASTFNLQLLCQSWVKLASGLQYDFLSCAELAVIVIGATWRSRDKTSHFTCWLGRLQNSVLVQVSYVVGLRVWWCQIEVLQASFFATKGRHHVGVTCHCRCLY